MNKPTKRTVEIEVAFKAIKRDLNVRQWDNYDLPSMVDSLLSIGRIVTPIILEEDANGELSVLQGNRRIRGTEVIWNDPSIPDEVKQGFAKVDCLVYKGLSETERLLLIVDQNTKGLNNTEVVLTVLRMFRNGMDFVEIGHILYRQLARYSQSEEKLVEFEKLVGKAREDALRKWFRGTVDVKILEAGARMGEYVKEQFLLTTLASDKGKDGGVNVEMKVDRDRIDKLRKAKAADIKAGGWSAEQGGEAFNTLISEFKKVDAGNAEPPEKKKGLTVKRCADLALASGHPAIVAAFQIAGGEKGISIDQMDDRLCRIEKVLALLRAHPSDLNAAIMAATEADDAVKDLEVLLLAPKQAS